MVVAEDRDALVNDVGPEPAGVRDRPDPGRARDVVRGHALQQVVDDEPPELAGRGRNNDHIRLLGYRVVQASRTATGLTVAMPSRRRNRSVEQRARLARGPFSASLTASLTTSRCRLG